MNNPNNSFLNELLTEIKEKYSDIIITIYGIGSFFDDLLPSDWKKIDIDIIVIVKSLEDIPKKDWTQVRYEEKEVNNFKVWIGFNTLKALQEKAFFNTESFSNYKWSLLELKYPLNSKILYGNDIRDQLPDPSNIQFDYDDILARSLYHLEKSLKEKNFINSKHEFTKGVFKFAFYLCIYFEKGFVHTSFITIGKKINDLVRNGNVSKEILKYFEEAMIFRIVNQYKTDFLHLRRNFMLYIFSLLAKGKLHKRMSFAEIVKFLNNYFSGSPYLVEFLQKEKEKYVKKKVQKYRPVRNWYSTLLNYRTKLELPKDVFYEVIKIFKLARSKKLMMGRSVDIVLPACIYCACRVHGIPISVEEIIKYERIPKKSVNKMYKLIHNEILTKLDLKFQIFSFIDYIEDFVEKLKLSSCCRKMAIKIINLAKSNGFELSGKDPKGIAAAALYYSSRQCNERLTQARISKIANISEVTLRSRLREVKSFT